ncbi:MAG: hypothetical protein KDE32_08485 [Novosphingobium sp.]|nr:hypothetical protein [Novosphingobium sp.]
MPIIDQTLTYTDIGDLLDRTTNPRHRKMLEKLYQHSRGEVEEDLEAVLGTLAPNPVYKIQSQGPEMNPSGLENVRRFYIEQIFGKGRHVLESTKDRIIVADDAIITEGKIRMILWGRDLIDQGNPAVDDPEGVYLMSYNSLIVWPYDEEARIIGEESWSYYPPDCLTKIDPAEAPESFHRYVARRKEELAAA